MRLLTANILGNNDRPNNRAVMPEALAHPGVIRRKLLAMRLLIP